MNTTTEDKVCPVCGDNYETEVSQLCPVWSEHYDNIVCVDCAETEKGAGK